MGYQGIEGVDPPVAPRLACPAGPDWGIASKSSILANYSRGELGIIN